jgi:ABC-type amino acid transport substrate-binding protein
MPNAQAAHPRRSPASVSKDGALRCADLPRRPSLVITHPIEFINGQPSHVEIVQDRPRHTRRPSPAARRIAQAQDTKVAIGISGWTGFAPLTLAKEAGIFKANGLDVSIKKIPQKDRHLAIASGDIQCAATTVETWIVWNANGIATTQLFKMDQGMGSDGIVARNTISKVADLKGKTVAASAPGTNPHFTLAWILKKNGMSLEGREARHARAGARSQCLRHRHWTSTPPSPTSPISAWCATSPSPAS